MEFERTKMDVLGWNVMITSWLDPQTQTWQAGAPGVTRGLESRDREGCSTRGEAIAKIKHQLENYFRAEARREAQG